MHSQSLPRSTHLLTNLLDISFKPNGKYAKQYSISINPEVDPKKDPVLYKEIFKGLAKEINEIYSPNIKLLVANTLFSSSDCPKIENTMAFTIDVRNTQYTVTITKTKNRINLESENEPQIKHFLELWTKAIFNANPDWLKFYNKGWNYYHYSREELSAKSQNVITLHGYSTSVINSSKGYKWLVNPSIKVINSKTALVKWVEWRQEFKNGAFKTNAMLFFTNRTVISNYEPFHTYKVSDITFDKNCLNLEIPIKDDNGKTYMISLFNYYKERYNITIKDASQPLLIVKQKKNNENQDIYWVPELCKITGYETEKEREMAMRKKRGKIEDKVTKMMDCKTWLSNKNNKRIKNKVFKSSEEIKNHWGIEFNNFLEIHSRILSPPTIQFANGADMNEGNKFYFKKVFDQSSSEIFLNQKWMILYLDVPHFAENWEKVMKNGFQRASTLLGLKIANPIVQGLPNQSTEEVINTLRGIHELRYMSIAIVLLKSTRNDLYKSIKHFWEEQAGIPSQFISEQKFNSIIHEGNLSIVTNILIQMLNKTGHQPYNIAFHSNLHSQPTMIIGWYSRLINQKTMLFTANATYDSCFFRTFVEYQRMESHAVPEMLVILLQKIVERFAKITTVKPKVIFIYRSGGNDTQTSQIEKEEVPVYIQALKCSWCIISVNKKSNLKFYKIKDTSNNNCKYDNPEKGTVIDREVLPENVKNEFYLQPHFVNQGCATPTHFKVLVNSLNIPLNDIQKITYDFSYYYSNWNGAIRVPSVLKYAEKWSDHIVKISGHSPNQVNINDSLMNKAFYI